MSRSRKLARYVRQPNAPPEDEPWIWLPLSMLESAAWRTLPIYARQVVDRLMIEHMHHGGRQNGTLKCTYDDFERYGIRRRSTRAGIECAIALGFIDVVERGVRAYGRLKRPSVYRLTWLPAAGEPATHRWKRVKPEHARHAVRDIRVKILKAGPQPPLGNSGVIALRNGAFPVAIEAPGS